MKSSSHDSAHLHLQGKSEFIDDRPVCEGEVFLDIVASKIAHGRIRKLSFDKARKVPGFQRAFTAADLKHNIWGSIFQDQPLLAEKNVNFVGEPFAVIAADSREAARMARESVKVQIEETPALLSIGAAKLAKSFIGEKRKIERGNASRAIADSPHKLSGKLIFRGADHFYLESQACVVYPREDDQLEVHSSSQHPTEVQHVIARALGLEDKNVTVTVKRMGGAFGGKESQAAPFATYAALAAHTLKRPARIVLTKDDDMIWTGKRNPFESEYRVGFDLSGRILGLDVELFSDGGAYADLSTAIMERALLHCDNAYYIPDFRATGQVCRTHFHPHTAFRGFGGPKGVATIERIIEEIAHFLKIDPLDVRKINSYRENRDITPYLQKVENNMLPDLFGSLEKDSDYRNRRKAIQAHNELAREGGAEDFKGLSLTAVKFGIAFTTRFLNQATALVHVHRDGTLQVSTGATEMGQGVQTRIATIVASTLGIPLEDVRIMPTSTDKNANTSPTAASSGTDLNGAAALKATELIKERLAQLADALLKSEKETWPSKAAGLGTQAEFEWKADEEIDVEFRSGFVWRKSEPGRKIKFNELVNEAYLSRLSLSEFSHYKYPHLSFNKITGKGRAFLYFTQGVAASEVSVNRITGEVKVRRVDLLMDLGKPINEALDLGQVMGGFVQGMGWVTNERLFYDPKGALKTHSPSTYKIPNIQDTPRIFRCRLIENRENMVNLFGSKAAGEPPLLLAISVWTAIHDALKGERFPRLEIPATQEEVLRQMAPEEFEFWENGK